MVLLALSAAAAILLFVGIKSKTSTGAPLQWQELSDSDISYWLENDSGELNSYDIAEVYQDVSLEPEFASDEELNDYLNEIDLEQIISEY